jgi:hypothetical protein
MVQRIFHRTRHPDNTNGTPFAKHKPPYCKPKDNNRWHQMRAHQVIPPTAERSHQLLHPSIVRCSTLGPAVLVHKHSEVFVTMQTPEGRNLTSSKSLQKPVIRKYRARASLDLSLLGTFLRISFSPISSTVHQNTFPRTENHFHHMLL